MKRYARPPTIEIIHGYINIYITTTRLLTRPFFYVHPIKFLRERREPISSLLFFLVRIHDLIEKDGSIDVQGESIKRAKRWNGDLIAGPTVLGNRLSCRLYIGQVNGCSPLDSRKRVRERERERENEPTQLEILK